MEIKSTKLQCKPTDRLGFQEAWIPTYELIFFLKSNFLDLRIELVYKDKSCK